MTQALMSPRDIAWHNDWQLRLTSWIKKFEEQALFVQAHSKTYVVDTVTSNSRLLERGAFPLQLRHTLFNLEADSKANITGGDGSVKEIREVIWNAAARTSPLVDEVRVRAARKQAAARMVRKVETMDDRQVAILDPVTELYVDLGRTNAEARPNSAVQGLRQVNFERGSLYSGGAKAVRDAVKQRQKYDAMPPVVAEKSKAEKVAELERKIAELMGLLK
jgi:hypothetical protein